MEKLTNIRLNQLSATSSNDYLQELERVISENYHSNKFPNISFPRADWNRLTDLGIMQSLIPKEFGGRDSHVELCDLIEIISKYNLPLGMYTMIITALFVRNVAKYGSDELKNEVLPLFNEKALIGGFALTEPLCGSNLARMGTMYEETANGYKITGEKHWQAFSVSADWWLVAARNKYNESEFSYFIIKREEGFKNVEEYNALGLKAIDYGRNEIDAFIPLYRKLDIHEEKLMGAVDMLCASRLSMSAMASGFLGRIYEEVKTCTQNRKIGKGTLLDIEFVKYKVQGIQANKTVAKSMFLYVKHRLDFRKNLNDNFFEAQAVKVLSTDKMLESALDYQQISGGEGYRYNSPYNSAAFALLDSRVYTVFDGTNDLLSQQIAGFCFDKSLWYDDVTEFLSNFERTKLGMRLIPFSLSILNSVETQAEKVLMGRVVSRLFGLNCLQEAVEGYEFEHIGIQEYKNAVNFLIMDIEKTVTEIRHLKTIMNYRLEEVLR